MTNPDKNDISDEINIIDIIKTLYLGRKKIIFSCLASLIITLLYYFLQPQHQTDHIFFKNLTSADFDQFNKPALFEILHPKDEEQKIIWQLFDYEIENKKFLSAFDSRINCKNFFSQKHKNSFSINEIESLCTKKIKLKKSLKKDETDYYNNLNYTYKHNKNNTDNILKDYYQHTLNNYNLELTTQAQKQLKEIISSQKNFIKELKKEYLKRNQDQIILFTEAYDIAKQLNITKAHHQNQKLSQKIPSKHLDESLLYMRGTVALSETIKHLEERKPHIESYIKDFRKTEKTLALFQSIKFANTIKPETITTSEKEKQSLALYLILSLFMGLFIGVIYIFCKSFYQNHFIKIREECLN